MRVRGTIERVDGDTYVVKARDGVELKLKLAPNAIVVALVKATLADIKQGSFVGVAGMPQADGSQKALEVHIFPETMRGVGDGPSRLGSAGHEHHDQRQRRADHAAADGQTLTLKYKDGEKKMHRPAGIPIVVLYVPGEVSELKAGAKIFVCAANKQPDGDAGDAGRQRRPWRGGAADVMRPLSSRVPVTGVQPTPCSGARGSMDSAAQGPG